MSRITSVLVLGCCSYLISIGSIQVFASVRVPVATISDHKVIDELVRKYFPGDTQSVVIPFSPYRLAELEGNFMDDYANTAKICRKAIRGSTDIEKKNCEHFLSFVKNAGFHN